MNEDWHQEQIFSWARANQIKDRRLCFLSASLSGVKLPISLATKMKKQGMRRGVPDISLPVKSGDFAGLFIELKKEGGRVKPEQKDWIEFLTGQGYRAVVCYGWMAAVDEISGYLAAAGRPESTTRGDHNKTHSQVWVGGKTMHKSGKTIFNDGGEEVVR